LHDERRIHDSNEVTEAGIGIMDVDPGFEHAYRMLRSSAGAPPGVGISQSRCLPAGVGGQNGTGRHDLIDAVQDFGAQPQLCCAELGLKLFHGARTDDGAGHSWMFGDERQRHVDQRHVVVVGELPQFIGSVELRLIDGVGQVESIGP